MNGGDSDVSLILYRSNEQTSPDLLEEIQQINVPGGEDAELFAIDDRVFLATASLRSGSDPDYDYNVESCIFEWDGTRMNEFQCVPTFGAKQWHSFGIGDRHFLALAQGPEGVSGAEPDIPANSTIYEWKGNKFEQFQAVPTRMGYNWLYFSWQGRHFLAYADHLEQSYVLEFSGGQFVHFQSLDGVSGRAFCFFEQNGEGLLAFSRISSDSLVYKWGGDRFQHYQTLPGSGGREFALIEDDKSSYLAHVKFITGTPDANPQSAVNSTVYRIENDGLHVATEFPTLGGTDVSTLRLKGKTYLVVTESLTQDLRFRQDSHVYQFISGSPNSTAQVHPASEGKLRRRAGNQSPEFLDLFAAYTSGPGSIGYQLRNSTTSALASNAMLVATSTDMIIYPGNGGDPTHLNFRLSSRGFIELASISHLAPAAASLVEMRQLGRSIEDILGLAKNLKEKAQAVKDVNSEALWKNNIAAAAFEGREANIAAMVDYACAVTIRLVDAITADPAKLTADFAQQHFLEAKNSSVGATIPMNHVMMATFFLVGLDTSYRMSDWLLQYDIDWANAMVLVTGQQGRETAGVTISSNSVAQVLLNSFPDLPVSRIYIAPHGPAPDITNATTNTLLGYEAEYRQLWGGLNGIAALGGTMFSGYPSYQVANNTSPVVNSTTTSVSELPAISGPDDWLAMTTRLRVVLEDVRQLLSGAVTDYAARQFRETGRNVSKVVVPGLDGYDYASA